jgi:hypothetical protein
MLCKNICRVASFFIGQSSCNEQKPESKIKSNAAVCQTRWSRRILISSYLNTAAALPDNQTFLVKLIHPLPGNGVRRRRRRTRKGY